MPNGETSLITKLIALGGVIAIGQVLVSQEKITIRMAVGRLLLGGPVSLISGVALIQMSNLPEMAIIGLASLLGIAGHTAIEVAAQRWLGKKGDDHDIK